MYQAFDVSTDKIDLVVAASTRVGDLLERGIDVSASPLAYLSTDLDKAKLEALQAATAEAKHRGEILVGGLGESSVGCGQPRWACTRSPRATRPK